MDPLSITASVIAVLQATEAVISICCNYRSAAKGASWDVSRVLDQVRSLRSVLRTLEELADRVETGSSDVRLPALKLLCNPKVGELAECLAEMKSLEGRLALPTWAGPAGSKRSSLVQALSWPLNKGETEKTLQTIERYKATLNLAITADQA